nr:hypothetical protein [Micromonospora sp. DSM 115978]
ARAYEVVAAPAHALTTSVSDAKALVEAVAAATHGHASLLVDSNGTADPAEVEAEMEAAARTTLALIDGRTVLTNPSGLTSIGDAARSAPR